MKSVYLCLIVVLNFHTGSSQVVRVNNESKASLVENEMSKYDAFTSARQLGGSTSASQAVYQGPGTRSNRSFDHDSPSSLDSKPGNAQSHDRNETMNQRDAKSGAKRKRGESSFSWDQNMDNSQQFDTHGTVDDQTRKMSKVEMPATGRNFFFKSRNFNTTFLFIISKLRITALYPTMLLFVHAVNC